MTTNAIIRVHQHGGPDCLSLDELPLEPLQPEHLLVEVQAAGVNFFDTQLRSGLYKQPLPLALGNEGAGIVREAGPGVTGFKAGDRVAWVQSAGSYARWKTIAADQVFPLPAGVSCLRFEMELFLEIVPMPGRVVVAVERVERKGEVARRSRRPH